MGGRLSGDECTLFSEYRFGEAGDDTEYLSAGSLFDSFDLSTSFGMGAKGSLACYPYGRSTGLLDITDVNCAIFQKT